jgi:hypothetical protein
MIIQFFLIITLFMNSTLINLEASNWKIVNDTVMGGVSTAEINNTTEGSIVFTGVVSLANNGGFCMIQSNLKKSTSDNVSICKITLKGDGKKYQIRLKKSRFDQESYVYEIQTTGKDQSIELKINEFKPQFRGQSLNLPPLMNESIAQVGILIGNKKEEPFELTIHRFSLE